MSSLDLGMDALKAGKLDEAVAHLEAATAESPGDYRGFNFLGIAYAKKGLVNRAIGALQAALKLRPNSALVNYNLGLAYKEDGATDRAREHFAAALAHDPMYERARKALDAILSEGIAERSCARHPNEPAVAECAMCRLPICAECRTVADGRVYCPTCAGTGAKQ
ncbi:MAG: tetratricopeptide repeat protein [Armatimonadota bacterium]